jgi:hypothetical protein
LIIHILTQGIVDYHKSRHYLYSLFEGALTHFQGTALTMFSFSRLHGTNLTMIGFDSANYPVKIHVCGWPGVTPPGVTYVTLFTGNDTNIPDTPVATVPASVTMGWIDYVTPESSMYLHLSIHEYILTNNF